MNRVNRSLSGLFYVLISSFFLTACSGLSDGVVQSIENIPDQLVRHNDFIVAKKTEFDQLGSHQEWLFFKPYLEKEGWEENFAKSKEFLAAADTLYQSKIIPIMDRDDPNEDTAARIQLRLFEIELEKSRQAALYPEQRIAFLINVRDTASVIHEKAQREFDQLIALAKKLTKRANNVSSDYAHKKDDVTEKLNVLNSLLEKASASSKQINYQFSKLSADIDYASFGDEAVALSKTLADTTDYQNKINEKFDELYKSYTKILADQRIEYFVVIGRASWCEGEYCGDGTTGYYPAVMIDEKLFEYFDSLQTDTIANLSSSWGRQNFKLNVPKAVWDALRIDKKWNWPRGDDYAEYWIEKIYTNTFHRYVEVVNEQMTEGEWIAVKEDDFWSQFDNLGMAILTKPYGYYEEDALKDAQPVGMATIAKPLMTNGLATGSNQYGEWRNENGRSFWHYYGMYSFFNALTGRPRYYYDDYNSYRSHRRGSPYYGRANEYGTWGSSTYDNGRYRDSDFARRNPADIQAARSGKSQRSSRAQSSIRGAGESSRSRGPAGGGK
ncbi:MAG: hypothetical protein OEY29_07060 [Gammaproteobacteria bacterium]|nr:hypothetical protein [Gammaproteobacteria bacterium]